MKVGRVVAVYVGPESAAATELASIGGSSCRIADSASWMYRYWPLRTCADVLNGPECFGSRRGFGGGRDGAPAARARRLVDI
ncbi:hypothetical protein PBRA_007227 [Plasmodiophora brassicae]|uniref:Uncharacterized protein n=1 Tax=Plasmodiophora brassicae TaxID=37360 RepID=A0A0G4IWG3_PLABS|nr:hypothetical protein PBRA_007227 [Plasmodiophora brassicae]